MTELREVMTSLGHTDVMTYIHSGNVLFTPRPAASTAPDPADAGALAAELERAIADGIGVRARAVVLSREELARCVRDNPYPGEADPRRLHAVFLPEIPGPGLAAWVIDAQRQVRAKGSRDSAQLIGRTVYLHTPDGRPANCAACSPGSEDRPRPPWPERRATGPLSAGCSSFAASSRPAPRPVSRAQFDDVQPAQ